MPGSSSRGKLLISRWFQQIPVKKTVLDIGAGWGTYSKLLREEGQIWHAVEVHKPYIQRFQLKKYYNQIFVVDIRKFNPKIIYDVVIMGDVVEHMVNKEAVKMLENIFNNSRYSIISLPIEAETHAPSDNYHDYWHNEYEEHKGSWDNESFMKAIKNLGGEILAMEKYQEIAIYLIATKANEHYVSENGGNFIEFWSFRWRWFKSYANKRWEIERILRELKQKFLKF